MYKLIHFQTKRKCLLSVSLHSLTSSSIWSCLSSIWLGFSITSSFSLLSPSSCTWFVSSAAAASAEVSSALPPSCGNSSAGCEGASPATVSPEGGFSGSLSVSLVSVTSPWELRMSSVAGAFSWIYYKRRW